MSSKSNILSSYLDRFGNLHCYKKDGREAPHKAVCLLTVMALVEKKVIRQNNIVPDETFERCFLSIWNHYVPKNLPFDPTWNNPFYHLKGDRFWTISWPEGATPSVKALRTAKATARLSDDLWGLMNDAVSREALCQQLVERYLVFEKAGESMAAESGTVWESRPCPFCSISQDSILFSTDLSLAFYDSYPVSKGHTLIVPKRHVDSYFDLTRPEKGDLWDCADRAKELLDTQYHPDGYNIGINVGEAAGQSIFHVHLHLIPRYIGDMDDPKGGVRGVIPGKQKY